MRENWLWQLWETWCGFQISWKHFFSNSVAQNAFFKLILRIQKQALQSSAYLGYIFKNPNSQIIKLVFLRGSLKSRFFAKFWLKMKNNRVTRSMWGLKAQKFQNFCNCIFFPQIFWKHECEWFLTRFSNTQLSFEKCGKTTEKLEKFTIWARAWQNRHFWIEKGKNSVNFKPHVKTHPTLNFESSELKKSD